MSVNGGFSAMNYTVLVVEDEINQRKALVERVDWAAAGFEIVGQAENGADALDKVELLEPDLILTDIKMPLINGLELAARVRELRPATQIVILSGYESFEYAKTAIDCNIISYLLKPISASELSEELFEIHRRMDERIGGIMNKENVDMAQQIKRLEVTEFLQPLMLGGLQESVNHEKLNARAKELGIVSDGESFCFAVLVSKYKNSDGTYSASPEHVLFADSILRKYIHSDSFCVFGRIVTLAVCKDMNDFENELELPLRELVQTSQRVMHELCTVGVSRSFERLSECPAAYFQAITARRYTSDGAGPIRFIDDQEKDEKFEFEYVEKSALKIEQLLKVGRDGELESFINALYENNTPENANLLVVQIIATVCRVVNSTSDINSLSELIEQNPIFTRITSYISESGMKNELITFCTHAKKIISQSQRRDSEILCDRVIQIIDSRYSDETLSLTEVSTELAVSPNYLSALIKKEKKKNFVALLTEKRMKAAYDMLVCSSMKVLEISQRCGYSDQHYFSYCFKKFYGYSPNKLRSEGRGEEA